MEASQETDHTPAQCQLLYGQTKHLPKITPPHDKHVCCVLGSQMNILLSKYTCQQKLHEQELCHFPVHIQVFTANFRFCAAPQWLVRRSAVEGKEAAQDAGQIYQASLLLTSPVTKRTKSSVLMNLATI